MQKKGRIVKMVRGTNIYRLSRFLKKMHEAYEARTFIGPGERLRNHLPLLQELELTAYSPPFCEENSLRNHSLLLPLPCCGPLFYHFFHCLVLFQPTKTTFCDNRVSKPGDESSCDDKIYSLNEK